MDGKVTAACVGAIVGLGTGFLIGRSKRVTPTSDTKEDRTTKSAVVLDATRHFSYPADVRPETKPPPPKPEVEGDPWDRQRVMVRFDQGKMEEQVCLVLGAGGLGQSVAFALARLGVRGMCLVDMDYFEASNLNRQVLGSKEDVGRRKVDVAESGLNKLHNIRSEITKLHINAVTNWSQIVEAARQSTVVFNCIDYGGVFDLAVNSLCKSLSIPYVAGSSFAYTAEVNYFSGKPGFKCWRCLNSVVDSYVFSKERQEELVAWMTKQGFPSSEDTELSASQLAVFLEASVWQIRATDSAPLIKQALAEMKKESVAVKEMPAFLLAYRAVSEELLLPTRVQEHKSIAFIPKDVHPPTRDYGSWVCVCTGAALLMVNSWVQGSIEEREDFPNYTLLTLTNCESQTSAQMGALPSSEPDCPVCSAQSQIAARQR